MKKLPREFYNRETSLVAQELLGYSLVHNSEGIKRVGKIVEVEAYIGRHDLASHSSKGLTKRTAVMFGEPGYAYVYLIYGIHHCFNIVTEESGIGAAVLIRALEPIENIFENTKGPGLVCRAMKITGHLNTKDLLSDELFITTEGYEKPESIIKTPRIGVPYAKEWANELLRFHIQGNQFISR
ncbi:MAG: DNA-3-methyladenine glycosylase [Tatlockia sp.]|nr:DNA-3-methyladenine glycosylase [Tatlockia sp.]